MSDDFTDRVLGAVGPQPLEPRGPGQDEFGYDLVPYTCAKCGVTDHVNPHLAEVYQTRRLWCLPCQSPHLWRWRRDGDTGERFLFPDPSGRKPPGRLGEAERRELELRHGELVDAQQRRAYLEECVATMQDELSRLVPRIAELQTAVLPAAQAALLAIETDPHRELKQDALDLARQINAAVRAAHEQKQRDAKEQARAPRSVAPRTT